MCIGLWLGGSGDAETSLRNRMFLKIETTVQRACHKVKKKATHKKIRPISEHFDSVLI